MAAISASSGTRVSPSSPIEMNRPQQLLRHLDPGEDLVVLLGIAEHHGERKREVGDVRERAAAADHERGEDREHLALEQLCELLAFLGRCLVGGRCGSRARPAPGAGRARAAAEPLALRRPARGSPSAAPSRTSRRRSASVPASTWSWRLATRTMKNSSRFDSQIATNLTRSSSGTERILGELEDPVVEIEPGELAVEVEVRVLEVREGSVLDRRPRWARLELGRLRAVSVSGCMQGQATAATPVTRPPGAARDPACVAIGSRACRA